MKKTLLTVLIMLLFSISANATMIIMDYQGDTVVRPNSVERNLLVNSDDGGVYNISVKPLEETMTNSEGTVKIPLDKVFINNTREDVYIRYNEYSNVFNALAMGEGVPMNLVAKIRDYGMVPAGIYTLPFEIQATDVESNDIVATSTFNLQFLVHATQDISLYSEKPKINITAKDAFNKNGKVANEVSPMVYINSNCDWELSINTDDFGDTVGNYYVRTVAASTNVNEKLIEKVLIQPNKEIVIAKGKAPANNEYVAVEYSLESKDGNFIPCGNYENRVKYILREIR